MYTFAEKYGAKPDKAVICLMKVREAFPAFYGFPAELRDHLRISNPIESVFRHRSPPNRASQGALSQKTAKLRSSNSFRL